MNAAGCRPGILRVRKECGFDSRRLHQWLAQWESTEPITRLSQVQILRQLYVVVCRSVSGADAVIRQPAAAPYWVRSAAPEGVLKRADTGPVQTPASPAAHRGARSRPRQRAG